MQQLTATITQKGQLTIPASLRKRFKIEKYDKIILEPAKDHVKIVPTKDVLDLAGSFGPVKGKSVLKAREKMESEYRRF